MTQRSEPIPVVFVEGFLGRGTPGYWGDIEQFNRPLPLELCGDGGAGEQKRRLLFVHLGTVSSLHDRACELYYQIKGGRVDYGVVHSKTHGHRRYGRTYGGLYPKWSSEHPLHFLGHSYGGVTVWYLQQLLMRGYFSAPAEERRDEVDDDVSGGTARSTGKGKDQGDWVRSLTGISAPFRGTTATYILGEREDVPARVRPISFGSFLYRLVHLYLYLDFPDAMRSYLYDFNVDHWGFGRSAAVVEGTADGIPDASEDAAPSPFSTLLSNLACSKWAEGRDCAPYDLTMRRMEWVNAQATVCTQTYYQSFAASMTKQYTPSGFHFPMLHCMLPLAFLSYFVGRYRFSDPKLIEEISNPCGIIESYDDEGLSGSGDKLLDDDPRLRPLPPSGQYDASEWWENDGLCSVTSQLHPGSCAEGYCSCGTKQKRSPGVAPAGTWVTHVLPATSHVDIVPDLKGAFFSAVEKHPREAVALAEEVTSTGRTWTSSISSTMNSVARSVMGVLPWRRVKNEMQARSSVQPMSQSSNSSTPTTINTSTTHLSLSHSTRHARVFRHYFEWLATIDAVEVLKSRTAAHSTPVGEPTHHHRRKTWTTVRQRSNVVRSRPPTAATNIKPASSSPSISTHRPCSLIIPSSMMPSSISWNNSSSSAPSSPRSPRLFFSTSTPSITTAHAAGTSLSRPASAEHFPSLSMGTRGDDHGICV